MRRKFLVSGLAVMALSSGGTLTAVASPAFASSGGTISVAYENYGTNITINNVDGRRRRASSRLSTRAGRSTSSPSLHPRTLITPSSTL